MNLYFGIISAQNETITSTKSYAVIANSQSEANGFGWQNCDKIFPDIERWHTKKVVLTQISRFFFVNGTKYEVKIEEANNG